MSTPAIPKSFASLSMAKVAYLEVGDPAKPPVLLVHGIPTSSYLWRHVLRLLQNDFHCIAPDLMGLGDTDVDAHTGRFGHSVDFSKVVVRDRELHIQIEQPVDFMGRRGIPVMGAGQSHKAVRIHGLQVVRLKYHLRRIFRQKLAQRANQSIVVLSRHVHLPLKE